MKRKLIRQGKGGYTVYLPKKWIDKKGLNAGDEIDLTEKEGSISIGSRSEARKSTQYNITPEMSTHNIRITLTHLYRNGYDQIILTNISERQIKEVSKIADRLLLGFEITDKKEGQCILENISEPTEEKYEVLIRRIFLIIKDSLNTLKTDYSQNNFKNYEEIQSQRDKTDKFILFCRRIITKEKNGGNPIIDWELLTFLMHIQHTTAYLYEYLLKTKKTRENQLEILIGELQNYYDLFYNGYFSKEKEKLEQIQNLRNKYQYGKCFELLESSKDPITASYLRELFRLIQIATSPVISELTNVHN